MIKKFQLVISLSLLVAIIFIYLIFTVRHTVDAQGENPTTEAIIEQTVRAALTQTARASTPEPLGLNEGVGEDGFEIVLIDYEFRPISNKNDEGAVEVWLSFVNNTDENVEVQINWYAVDGTDNIGTKYGERNSVGDRYFSWSNAEESLSNWNMEVSANSVEDLYFDLHVEDNNSGHVTRVDIRTDWIDLKIPSIVFRTDELHRVSGFWRLNRN